MPESVEEPPGPKPRRRRGEVPTWVSVTAIVAVVAAAGGGYYYAGLPKNGVRVERMEADARQSLPRGSTRDDALAWFAARGITDVRDLTDTGGTKIGYHATVPNDSWLDQAEIDIKVGFDRSGALERLEVARYRAATR